MPSPVMRVLLTCDCVGGVWTYALALASTLLKRGVHVTLAVVGPAASEDQKRAVPAKAGLDVIEVEGALDWTARSRDEVLATGQRLRRLAVASGADLVHLNCPAFAGPEPWPVPVVSGAHSCLGTWWRAVKRGVLPREFIWRVAKTGEGLRASSAVMVPSTSFARDVLTLYGVGVRVFVVRNGLSWREGSACAGGQIFTAGRLWDEGKNFATLDQAAGLLQTPILAAGALEGPNGEQARFGNLVCLGPLRRDEMEAQFRASSIYVAPSLYEPFGLSVLEAAQRGAALVLADIPTFRELWSGAALFVSPRDSRAWAAALARLKSDPVLTARLAKAALQRASLYSAQRMADGVLSVYRRVLRQPSSAELERASS